jgi:uncharacterized protein (TIGR00725 family)
LAKSQTLYIGVIGAGTCSKKLRDQAHDVGFAIGKRKAILVCGGLKGVMEGACRGAKEAGGITVGIIPGLDRTAANKYCDIVIPSGIGEARNALIVRTADALVSLHGKYGTISEMALALKTGKPLVSLVRWDVMPEVVCIEDPDLAVEEALNMIHDGNEEH